MTETDGSMKCVECGKELTDPKNSGDPDVNGDWVCRDRICRGIHDAEMTVNLGDLFG